MNMARRVGAIAATIALGGSAAVALATPASAGGYAYAKCDKSYMPYCITLWYNSNRQGSSSVLDYDQEFENDKFINPGAGQGQGMKNNAASALSWSAGYGPVYPTIYYNSHGKGPCDIVMPGAVVNRLHYTYNENASYDPAVFKPSGCYVFS